MTCFVKWNRFLETVRHWDVKLLFKFAIKKTPTFKRKRTMKNLASWKMNMNQRNETISPLRGWKGLFLSWLRMKHLKIRFQGSNPLAGLCDSELNLLAWQIGFYRWLDLKTKYTAWMITSKRAHTEWPPLCVCADGEGWGGGVASAAVQSRPHRIWSLSIRKAVDSLCYSVLRISIQEQVQKNMAADLEEWGWEQKPKLEVRTQRMDSWTSKPGSITSMLHVPRKLKTEWSGIEVKQIWILFVLQAANGSSLNIHFIICDIGLTRHLS